MLAWLHNNSQAFFFLVTVLCYLYYIFLTFGFIVTLETLKFI